MVVFYRYQEKEEIYMIEAAAISFNFIKKEPVSGSYEGMRYLLTKKNDEIEAVIWPEPYNYSKTPEEQKIRKKFPLSGEGTEEAVNWQNEQFIQQGELWNRVLHTPWV